MSQNETPLSSPTDWVSDHVRRYVDSDGADGHIMNGVQCLLLTTRGHKSGQLRRTPLVYGQDGDRFVIIASRGGNDSHPAWFLNVEADPEVEIQVLAEHHRLRARIAEGEERTAKWKMMVEIFAEFEEYQKKTSRQIPVVILEPR
jgi:deazaflavin-dependent oxidoreductase (nitroreductase family)